MTMPSDHYRVVVCVGSTPISEIYFVDKEESLIEFLSFSKMLWAEQNEEVRELTIEQVQAGSADDDNNMMAIGTDAFNVRWIKCSENEYFPFSLN